MKVAVWDDQILALVCEVQKKKREKKERYKLQIFFLRAPYCGEDFESFFLGQQWHVFRHFIFAYMSRGCDIRESQFRNY